MTEASSRRRILDAALSLVERRGGADVTMADIAGAAGLSRQAVYLHFADRAALLLALVRHVDEKRGLEREVRKIAQAPDGAAAVAAMISLQARLNPGVWAVARALDAVRRRDPAVERSWQDRLANRLRGCREIVARLAREGSLRPGLGRKEAADLLWSWTSLRAWEDLVLERRWTAERYRSRLTEVLLGALAGAGPRRPVSPRARRPPIRGAASRR
ncbi:MAG TPA: TetR family transcriptional regulator [Myxococcaceae bacterium]|nr:TetR family transcriptional regulator [Myxococcaceae bacterium]